VDGSGGLEVPVEFVGTVLLNGFFFGCCETVYDGNDELDELDVFVELVLLVLLVLLALLVSDEFDEPEVVSGIISNMYNLF
jgi:hypothetical protein